MITVEANNLSKVYHEGTVDVPAVRGVSLAVEQGEMVGIMGPSGSGKTTLLSMLGCILRPTEGTLAVQGEPVDGFDERRLPALRRRCIGFIFQSFNLFGALTALENVEVVLNLKGVKGHEAWDQAARLLDRVGLEDRAHFLPRDLSGGEKQRVSVARAMAGDPPLILADEPTANLDGKNGEQVIRLLRNAARAEGRSVIVVTHDHRIRPYMDRILQLEDGRLVT
ncbi:MAG TPA: ABC transporter ATP-binding protein [Methylomirabilota bacterium]|nr:ABC transporter ATP-binding protein [Methylomirabilota bacterium]